MKTRTNSISQLSQRLQDGSIIPSKGRNPGYRGRYQDPCDLVSSLGSQEACCCGSRDASTEVLDGSRVHLGRSLLPPTTFFDCFAGCVRLAQFHYAARFDHPEGRVAVGSTAPCASPNRSPCRCPVCGVVSWTVGNRVTCKTSIPTYVLRPVATKGTKRLCE